MKHIAKLIKPACTDHFRKKAVPGSVKKFAEKTADTTS